MAHKNNRRSIFGVALVVAIRGSCYWLGHRIRAHKGSMTLGSQTLCTRGVQSVGGPKEETLAARKGGWLSRRAKIVACCRS